MYSVLYYLNIIVKCPQQLVPNNKANTLSFFQYNINPPQLQIVVMISFYQYFYSNYFISYNIFVYLL